MTVTWSDISKWDVGRMREQYDELAARLNHLDGSQARLEAVDQTIQDGWQGPAGSEAADGARKAAETLDHARQIMDKLKAAAQSSEPLVQKAKDAQKHAEELAAQKQFAIDPATTSLRDLADPPKFTTLLAFAQYIMRRQQDALEVRNAINETLRLGDEAEQFAERAICEAAGLPYTPPAQDDRQFYPDQLFGPDGQPRSGDTAQNGMGDCTVVATIAAMADNDPESIKKMIRYNPSTGNYEVTFTIDGKQVTETVTQEELRANVKLGGGSRIDGGNGDPNAPFWPSVIETAYAKTRPPTDPSSLDEGQKKQLAEYQKASPQYGEELFRIAHGGSGPESLTQLTGKPVTSYNGNDAVKPENVAKIQQAIADHKPILFGTTVDPQDRNGPTMHDGIPNGHAMQVQEIHVDPNTHHVVATVRNPWGNNNNVEGHYGEYPASFQVDLTELDKNGGLSSIDVAG